MVDILKLKAKQKVYYKKIVSVPCPILGDEVFFTSEGYNHLLYERHNSPRNISEQYLKLMCLSHAVEVVKKCVLISETRKLKKEIKGKMKDVIQYGLVYEVSPGEKIKVVVEKVGNGKHKFKSIMPYERRRKSKKRH